MDDWRTLPVDGLAGAPGPLALTGVTLFVLLSLVAAVVLNAHRMPQSVRLSAPRSLRARITLAMVLMATVPAISLALVLSDRASGQRAERVAAALQAQAAGLADSLGFVIDTAAASVTALAAHVARGNGFDRATLERQLLMHHERSPALVSLAALAHDGTALAASAAINGAIVPFASATDASLEPASHNHAGARVSDASIDMLVPGRTVIRLSAPIEAADGTTRGTIVGGLDLAATGILDHRRDAEEAPELVVVDAQGQVVLATPGSGFAPRATLPAELRHATLQEPGRPFQVEARTKAAAPARFIGAAAALEPNLSVLLLAPASALQAARTEELLVALGWLIGALLVAAGLAVALAGDVAGPLGALDAAVRGFDPERHGEVATAPAGAPREVAVVFEHLATVARRQRAAYEELQVAVREGERLRRELISVLDGREAEIRERTRELKQSNEQLDRLTRTDPLTGVANRRGLAEFLDRTWRTGLREQHPVSLLLVDVDHFKAYNDVHGHPQGDRCLQAVANAISHVASRGSDAVARYGGEEFAVVLGNTPLEGALQLGEQIRSAIEALGIPHRGAPSVVNVTVSVGVASCQPARGTEADVCLEAADRALYAAKEQGRNRVGYSTTARTGLYQALSVVPDRDRRLS